MPHRLHLSAALDGAGRHPAAWRAAGLRPADLFTAGYWTDLARLAESATLDFVTLGDSLAPPADRDDRIRGRLDALATLTRTAPATRRLGLVPTVTTTHTEPFHTAISLQTLDWVSEGRAGWLVEVSDTAAEARAVGRRPVASGRDLWAEAADAAEVAARLWDSWEDDAEIRDATTGRFIDREKLHPIDFEGPHFAVRGPSIVPRSPQGQVVVAVALDPADVDQRWALAAEHAEVVLLSARHPATAHAAREVLRRRVADAGRDPDTVTVQVRIAVTLAGSPAAARDRAARLDALAPDDEPGTVSYTGTPDGLADLFAEWLRAGAADGFHLLPAVLPTDLAAVADELVPLLRARGLFRTGYSGRTLRDHLGLTRPASRYAGPQAGPQAGPHASAHAASEVA
ncbi:LLM class flavin-dependent oxidoreductase [Peterkaempfera bronchialis]|uniref:LLM class flavin-dependent oxidoreductase n=1 Tax=Peterkaempfera bronchialis TaxID=2126346 RepID=A0A345T0D9_9ACTN|nr:LLM class flavin-dependent oxidoreductase [Peterkaempfera bronchialis]AXI79444.1 LLM class flavin-dependent oxidoreductase [Peterkaempfera bronchialis]